MQASAAIMDNSQIEEAHTHRSQTGKSGQATEGRAGMHPVRVVIAGGGTGGHLFPGIAIAEEVLSRNKENDVLFIGTGNALEQSVLGEKGLKFTAIAVQGL